MSLRFLVSFMCLVAVFEYNFLNASIFPKAILDFKAALGDDAITKLPDITQVILAFQSSTLWHLSALLALVIMLLVWLLRPAWMIGVLGALMLLWTISVPSLTFFELWFGDKLILKTIELSTKAKGLL